MTSLAYTLDEFKAIVLARGWLGVASNANHAVALLQEGASARRSNALGGPRDNHRLHHWDNPG